MDKMTSNIRLRARKLCREIRVSSLKDVKTRNEEIIRILMREFHLTHEEAEFHFMNNNVSE